MKTNLGRIGSACIALAMSSAIGVQAEAAPITINYSGTVLFADGSLASNGATFGASISGVITYETTTPDNQPGDPQLGIYSGAVTTLTYNVGFMAGASINGSVGIGNDQPPGSTQGDTFQALGASSFSGISGTGNLDFQFRLKDFQATALSDDSLPLSGAFVGGGNFSGVSDQAFLTLYLYNGGFNGVSGSNFILDQGGPIALLATLTELSFETVDVPEPAIFGLLAAGAAGLGWFGRRSRRRAAERQES